MPHDTDTRIAHHLGTIEGAALMAPVHDPKRAENALRRILQYAQRQHDHDSPEALLWAQVVSIARGGLE